MQDSNDRMNTARNSLIFISSAIVAVKAASNQRVVAWNPNNKQSLIFEAKFDVPAWTSGITLQTPTIHEI